MIFLGADIIKNRRTYSTGKNVKWLKIKRLLYEKCNQNVVRYSYDYTGPYQVINVTASKKNISPGRPSKLTLKQQYSAVLPTFQAKKKDPANLCKTGVVPKENHSWMMSLKSSKNNIADVTPEPTGQEYFFSEEDE